MTILDYSPRTLFLALFMGCVALLATALYLQHATGLEPCPMCIMQRYVFIAIAAVALIATLHGPARRGSVVYGGLVTLLALVGAGVAAQQSRIQLQPPSLAECGPGVEYMVNTFGLSEALPMMFRGAGDCASSDWTLLGLTLANWSLLTLLAIAIYGGLVVWRGGRRSAVFN